MEKRAIDAVDNDPHPMGVNSVRRNVTDALDADHVAMVYYELEPGESFSGGLHTHHDQEEVFVVLEGTATFEHTLDREEITVAAGEAIRFAPGEFQHGRNDTDDRVVGVALAAPGAQHNWEDIESKAPCPECGELTSFGVEEPDGGMVIYCMACDTTLQIA